MTLRSNCYVVALGVLVSLFAACSSTHQRIEAHQVAFKELEPEVQQSIRRGEVQTGFTPAMTFMSLGAPNRVVATADAREVTWTYLNYNSAGGGFVSAPKHIFSSRQLAPESILFGGGARAIPQMGRSTTAPSISTGDTGAMGIGEAGSGVRGISGRDDLINGELKVQDSATRRKTASERITDDDDRSANLLIRFVDGQVESAKLVLLVGGVERSTGTPYQK